ncbi:MAG: ATP-dependent helicase [Acidimicrobiales bacterium]
MEPREARSIGRAPRAVLEGDSFETVLEGLTESQARAVASDARALCVVAGAGSGKTRVLTLRMARRIRDGSAAADHTVACTFTRKAARELQERLRGYGVAVSPPAPIGVATAPGVRAGTIHRLALGLLRRHALDSGRPVPTIDGDRIARLHRITGDRAVAAAVDVEIGWAKAQCLSPERYGMAAARAGRNPVVAPERVVEVFVAYQGSLRRAERVDLDDILVQATERLVEDQAFADRAHWRYRHLFVDEFQDINPAQYAFVDALSGEEKDLCAVGDPNQAIYGWNGADPTLLGRLADLVPSLETIALGENHRSTPQVVAAAAAALGDSGVAPPRSATPDGPLPVITAYDDAIAEAEGIVSVLLEWREDGIPWDEQAVLARTHDQLLEITAALGRAGIPVRMASSPERDRANEQTDDRPAEGGKAGAVELATFHRAKGLEWTAVCVAGLEDGYVPIVHAGTDASRAEERRLLYVALTRASRELHCSWARTRATGAGRKVERRPSPWLAPIERLARPGTGRIGPTEGRGRVAALRAGLGATPTLSRRPRR